MLIKPTYQLLFAIALLVIEPASAHALNNARSVSDTARVGSMESNLRVDVIELSQKGRSSLKSRSDVIAEVKRRYNAEVLKISLDERQQVYRVRVLMKNGKVRNLQVSARR